MSLFYRITLVSEHLSKLHFGQKMTLILNFMIGVLGRGVQIGNQGSQIVNYSNSQLKNHSVWMLVKTDLPELQIDCIIKELGDFNKDGGLLKMFARRGQCFTTTKYITKLESGDIKHLDDIMRDRLDGDPGEKYTFSDGCGRISPELARMIDEKFNLH
jgi:RNA-dependent RNA polymerase